MRDPFSVAEPYLKAERPAGRIVAVEICSTVLQAHVWFALDDSFDAGDGLAVFYSDELQPLATMTAEELKAIYRTKLVFPGARVRE